MAALVWFRKALRVHDNPALLHALRSAPSVLPAFVLDPQFTTPQDDHNGSGVGRPNGTVFRFFLECLEDLDSSIAAASKGTSRLHCFRGDPVDVLPKVWKAYGITSLYYETDSEPYARDRDARVTRLASESGVEVHPFSGHTLYPLDTLLRKAGDPPKTYRSFLKLAAAMGPPGGPLPSPSESEWRPVPKGSGEWETSIPTLGELRYDSTARGSPFKGGESVAQKRLAAYLKDKKRVCSFRKPQTSPNSLEPSTTVLSPYITTGALSVRTFYHSVDQVYKGRAHSSPPESLHGQLLFREWFYLLSYTTPNFHRMEGNPICKPIPWDTFDKEKVERWRTGRTGYPFIDACMTQLRTEGWIHHLARHAVACFLTRGDLWQHWEVGRATFEEMLLDGDYALNSANWMWLSASAFFTAYFRVYSPVSFGKKTDPKGDYIRKYLPVLAKYDSKYIYEPWTAPASEQRAAGCIIGKDYPSPIVDHAEAMKSNLSKLSAAYKSVSSKRPPDEPSTTKKKQKTARSKK